MQYLSIRRNLGNVMHILPSRSFRHSPLPGHASDRAREPISTNRCPTTVSARKEEAKNRLAECVKKKRRKKLLFLSLTNFNKRRLGRVCHETRVVFLLRGNARDCILRRDLCEAVCAYANWQPFAVMLSGVFVKEKLRYTNLARC